MNSETTPADNDQWWDDNGYLHPHGENGLMFALEYHILKNNSNRAWELLHVNMLTNNGELRDYPSCPDPKVSHDNYTLAYCAAFKFGNFDILDRLKIFSKYRMHPRDIAFYLYCKYPWIGFWFLWITSLSMMHSCWKVWKVRPHGKFVATDGKILALMRCAAADMNITYKVCTWLLSRNPYVPTWKKVIDLYFNAEAYPYHPMVHGFEEDE